MGGGESEGEGWGEGVKIYFTLLSLFSSRETVIYAHNSHFCQRVLSEIVADGWEVAFWRSVQS